MRRIEMLNKIINEKDRIIAAIMLISAGVLIRIALNGFNYSTPRIYITLNGITQPMFMMDVFFVVALIALLSGLLLGGYYTFIVPLSVMAISDIYIGNTFIILFVWSGFAIIGLIGYMLKRKKCLTLKRAPILIGAGVGGVLLYDLWTNFGCWLGWYPHTLNGLTMCFTVAVPFTLWHLLSTTIAITAIILPIAYLKDRKVIKTDYAIKPVERHITYIAPALLMVVAIIMTVF